jgi:hypothetical protein
MLLGGKPPITMSVCGRSDQPFPLKGCYQGRSALSQSSILGGEFLCFESFETNYRFKLLGYGIPMSKARGVAGAFLLLKVLLHLIYWCYPRRERRFGLIGAVGRRDRSRDLSVPTEIRQIYGGV